MRLGAVEVMRPSWMGASKAAFACPQYCPTPSSARWWGAMRLAVSCSAQGGGVLVTGAAGFIGSHVVERLLWMGERVVAIDSMSEGSGPYPAAWKEHNTRFLQALSDEGDTPGTVKFIRADIRDRQAVEAAFQDPAGISRVCHLAAVSGVADTLQRPEEGVAVNVGGTALLMDCAGRAGCRSFVLASSGSVYGDTASPRAMREEEASRELISPYAASKMSAELMAPVFSSMHGLPATVLRVFTTYGPRGRPDMVVQRFMERMLSGQSIQQFGSGESFRDYVYVEDVACAFTTALFHDALDAAPTGPTRTYNVAGGRCITLAQLIRLVEEATGVQAQVEVREQRQADVRGTYADISAAELWLGWKPEVSLEEGLRRTVEWTLTDHGYVTGQ
mmetsp:Transcript_20881/g.57909  ORF Transcript_20881/g.57909 Transcript_20881/m.57909 type:complete len:390 (+) Transcript_20881:99-1268(+)